MMESTEKAVAAYGDLVSVVTGMVAERRERPRHDLTSWFLTHPAGLDNDEVVRQITLTMIAGNQPTTNLIGNALMRLLTDARYAGSLFGGAMTAYQAIDEVLWHDPPLANLSAHYPRYDITFHGREIPAYCWCWSPTGPPTRRPRRPPTAPSCAAASPPTWPGRPARTPVRPGTRRC